MEVIISFVVLFIIAILADTDVRNYLIVKGKRVNFD